MMPTHPRRAAPLVVAHRGASAYAPENTIAAYELALDQGADALEIDVHLSRDDQPVVIHDFTLERTTDGRGRVRDLTVSELKRLDAGSWFGSRHRGERIQTLQEVLERFRERTQFVVELKAGSEVYPGIEEQVVSLLRACVAEERSLVFSFNLDTLAKIREISPGMRTGALVTHPPFDPAAVKSVATALCPAAHLFTADAAAEARTAGLETYVWVVNDAAAMDRMTDLGVTGILTDRPDLLRARLSARGAL
jgi:glycerophosphoryl diester phosphodiesterase